MGEPESKSNQLLEVPQDEKEKGLWLFVYSPLRINPQVTSFQTSGRPSTGGGLSDSQPWAPAAAAASAHLMKEEQVGESGMNMAQLYIATSGKSLCCVGPQSLTLPSKGHSLNFTQFPSSLPHTWG